MAANDLMGRYADVQIAVDSLLETSRQLCDRSIPTSDENLRLVEDGLFFVGHELLEIAQDLRAEAKALEINNRQAVTFLEQCQELLVKHERLAVQNGLLPAMEEDRRHRVAPAASYPTDRFDVEINADAGVVVVREKPSVRAAADIIPLPVGLARHLYRQSRQGDEPGGAA